ncbi:hypothetical protein [Kosakonia sp. S42]|nr:hypothetical protein [Kosakonia sp. S42]
MLTPIEGAQALALFLFLFLFLFLLLEMVPCGFPFPAQVNRH